MKIATYTGTKHLLDKYNLRAKKGLGQNFLIEPGIIDKIVHVANIDKKDIVLEVGPGLGSLTQGLLEQAGEVISLEIDPALIPVLTTEFANCENFNLIHQDVMKANLQEILAKVQAKGDYNEEFTVVANLPYYITTPIMMLFLEGDLPWKRMVFMMQKEVAERLCAKAGTKDYGAITLAINYRSNVKKAFNVPPKVFIPRPNVDSAVVVLERLPEPRVQVNDEKLLFRVIKAGFSQRRKTLLNSMSATMQIEKAEIEKILEKANIDSGRRGETLTLEEFAAIANTFA